MNLLPKICRAMLGFTLAFVLSHALAAQQEVCISVHAGPATGVTNLGGPSSVSSRVKVNGVNDTTTVNPAAGQGAAAVSAAQEAAYRRKGFATRRINANEFCLTAGPGGAPLTDGLCVGSDDTGLDIDGGVRRLPPAVPGRPPANPGAKGGGIGIAVPPVQQPPIQLPQPVEIRIVIEVVDANGNVRLIVVRVVIFPDMTVQQLIQQLEQALRQAGLTPWRGRWRSALDPYRLWDGYVLDRTVLGETVQHVEYQYDALARRVLPPQELAAGHLPEHGIADFGLPTLGAARRMPSASANGFPQVNSFFDITYELELPNAPGGEIIGFLRCELPVPSFGGYLYVDPIGSVFLMQLTDAAGRVHHQYVLPGDPALVGVKLYAQGLALDLPTMTLSMTNALRIGIGH